MANENDANSVDTGPVAVVASDDPATSNERVKHFGAPRLVPIVCGVFVLALNAYLLTAGPVAYFFKNAAAWGVAMSTTLVLTSIFIGLLLVMQPFVLGARHGTQSVDGLSYGRRLLVPVALVLLAVLADLWAVQRWTSEVEQGRTPCIEVYDRAEGIRKDNPKFRMPADSPDELRCKVNQSVLS